MEMSSTIVNESPNKTKPKKRRIQIDVFTGFRGISAIWVFLFHRSIKSESEVDIIHLEWIGMTGQVGVALFFALSGFIMVWVYGECRFTSARCYWSFIGRRVARLLPLYYFSMVLSIYDGKCMWNSENPCQGRDWLAIIFTIIPIRSWTIFNISQLLWNPPLWSVQTEFFFYLSFPFLLRLTRYLLKTTSFVLLAEDTHRKQALKRIGIMWIVTSIISAIPIIIRLATPDHLEMSVLYRGQTVAYYTPYARIPEFILGMLTCILFIIYTNKSKEEPASTDVTTLLIEKDETKQRNEKVSWFKQFRANYKYWYILLELYFLLQTFFFFIIRSPLLGGGKTINKYDDIITFGPFIELIICSTLYLYANYPWTLVSQILVTKLLVNMGDISYAFYCFVEALPKLTVLFLGTVETSAIMRFWAGIGIAAFGHHYIEIIIYNWANKRLPRCTCS